MRTAKLIAILFVAYVGIVVVFESLIGYLQPASETTLVITTADDDGISSDRVVSRLESQGKLYVAANHWPRAWYNQALKDPKVQITMDGEKANYLAVPVSGQEHDQVDAENSLGTMFRVMTGFPPRYFIRLDPR